MYLRLVRLFPREYAPTCRLTCPLRLPFLASVVQFISSPSHASPRTEAGAGRNGGGGAREQEQGMTSNGNRGNGKGKEAEPGDDNGGGSDRARRGSGRVESVSPAAANGDASGATASTAAAAAAAARDRATAGPPRSGGPPERGTKRLSEVELDSAPVATAAGGGSAGERGALGRPRGKMPRGRSHTSAAAPGVSSLGSAAPAAVAVEGRGAGSSGRRIRGRSPM